MIVEKLIFTAIAFMFFIYIFLKMIKENDTNYIFVLILQAIGIAINFLQVLLEIAIGPFFMIIKYMFSVLLPIGIITLDKRNIPLMQVLNVFKAKMFIKFGNNKNAKQQLINLVSKYPENYIGHRMLAEIYESEGGMRKAIDEYVQAVDINKRDYDSYYKVSELLINLDKKDEAQEMLYNLLSKKPEYYKATELLGDILISKEMYKEAVNIYQDALRYQPLSFDINYNLGIAYTMLNDFENAKICYEKAAKINALSYSSKYYLAEISLIYKEIEEAEKYFLEAVEDEELSADAYLELAKISMIKNDKETAINYANIAIDINAKGIAPKIKEDPIFIPVLVKIQIPFNLENLEEKESSLKPEEIIAKEHLENMFEITRNLDYYDINLLKPDREEEKNQNLSDREK